MSLHLGIDVGTSGVRTAVITPDGAIVSMARAPHLAQDPERIDARRWWEAVVACLGQQVACLAEAGHDPSAIGAIAVDATSGSMVLTDAACQPVSRALMYNSAGFEAEAARIAEHAPDPHITRGANSALARAMRLLAETGAETGAEAEAGAKTGAQPMHLMHQADYIAAMLTGRGGRSDHNNALKTGYDPETDDGTGAWPDWIGAVFPEALLPQVHAVATPLDRLAPAVADRFGLSPNAVVHAGTTDSIAAFFASAPLEPGVAVTSLGSTLAIKLLSARRIDDPAIGLYAHRVGDLWLTGGASNTGGAVLASFFSPEEIARLSEGIDPAAETGLDYYPLLRPGERFPINDPALPPRLTPRPGDDAAFLQGMFEGIARIEAQCYREIARRGGSYPSSLFTAGGGAANAVFTAIRARVLGLSPATPPHSEAAIGAAMLTLRG
ncbi:MAG: FGGY-family carbohydrate kinase [Pseudomonadota bacterium]